MGCYVVDPELKNQIKMDIDPKYFDLNQCILTCYEYSYIHAFIKG